VKYDQQFKEAAVNMVIIRGWDDSEATRDLGISPIYYITGSGR
jgi:hypothetical protein